MLRNIKYLYLEDPKDNRRRLTIARYLDKQNQLVTFSYAVNRPPKKGLKNGDLFIKSRGRDISTGRLNKGNGNVFMISLLDGERPVPKIIKALSLSEEVPECVKRIVQRYIN